MSAASQLVKLQGYSTVVQGLNQLHDEWSTSASLIVGTPAEYAIFVHEGTSRMEGRPFLKDAVEEVARKRGDEMVKRANSGDELVLMVALEMEAETKRKITDYGAVDTGNMRAGVAAVRL